LPRMRKHSSGSLVPLIQTRMRIAFSLAELERILREQFLPYPNRVDKFAQHHT
jgi:hypothetical protein